MKTVMLSGAGSGIGRAILDVLLLDKQYRVSAGVKDDSLKKMNAGRMAVFHYDALHPHSAVEWVDDTISEFGQIDVLINNAAVMYQDDFPKDFSSGGYLSVVHNMNEMYDVNMKAPFYSTQLVFPYVKKKKGRIINISSISGKGIYSQGAIGYCMTKHAVVALSRAFYEEGAKCGVNVTTLCPGRVNTDMGYSDDVDMGKVLQPEDIAGVVEFLLRLPDRVIIPELSVIDVFNRDFK